MAFISLANRINDIDTPVLICGPILRRVETNAVTVWVALKEEKKVWLEVYENIAGAGSPPKYPGRFFKAATKSAGASQAVLSYQNNRVSMNAPAKIAIQEEQYVLANVSDMKLYDDTLTAASYTEALQHYNELIRQKPVLKDQIQVLSEYELN